MFTIYQDRDDINIAIEYVDTLAIEIPKEELNTNHNTVIISIYRPPSMQQNLSTEKLGDLLNYLSRENKLIYILGDINIDTSNAIISPNIGVNDDWGGANSRFLGLVSVWAARSFYQTALIPSVIKRIRQIDVKYITHITSFGVTCVKTHV